MKEFEFIERQLDQGLQSIADKQISPVEKAEQSIQACSDCLKTFKSLVAAHNFDQESKEIRFFKHMKPRILAKLLYYIYVRNLEEMTSFKYDKCKLKYYRKKLRKIGRFKKKNDAFIKYYKSEKTDMDNLFFKRLKVEEANPDEPELLQYDAAFCTSHDYKAAKVIAKEELVKYIAANLKTLINPASGQAEQSDGGQFRWTGSKIDLAELIYALVESKAIDNGNAELIDVATFFGNAFNLDFGDFYHKFIDIKARKIDQTKFLNHLVSCLIARINRD